MKDTAIRGSSAVCIRPIVKSRSVESGVEGSLRLGMDHKKEPTPQKGPSPKLYSTSHKEMFTGFVEADTLSLLSPVSQIHFVLFPS